MNNKIKNFMGELSDIKTEKPCWVVENEGPLEKCYFRAINPKEIVIETKKPLNKTSRIFVYFPKSDRFGFNNIAGKIKSAQRNSNYYISRIKISKLIN